MKKEMILNRPWQKMFFSLLQQSEYLIATCIGLNISEKQDLGVNSSGQVQVQLGEGEAYRTFCLLSARCHFIEVSLNCHRLQDEIYEPFCAHGFQEMKYSIVTLILRF